MSFAYRNVIAATVLISAFISNAQAWGCPPWMPCGKHRNLIIPDSEYGRSVTATVSAGPVILQQPQPQVEPQNIDADVELRRSDAELLQARAIADGLSKAQQINRTSQNVQIVDWGLPRN